MIGILSINKNKEERAIALPIRRSPARITQPAHKINNRITAKVVRVVGEEIEAEVMSIQDALKAGRQP